MKKYTTLLFLLVTGFSACRKKDLPATDPKVATPKDSTQSATAKGSITVTINHMVGEKAILGTSTLARYNAPNGDEYSITTLNYYLSNIVFVDEKGNRFTEPSSYRLMQLKNMPLISFNIDSIAAANYTKIEFLIGVDSIRNVSGVQSGVLDPSFGMFWSWSTGYIMAKMEGNSSVSTAPDNAISYHISGFKGSYNSIRKISLDFPSKLTVQKDKSSTVNLVADVNNWFNTPNFNGFSNTPIIASEGEKASKMADNYNAMMSIKSVENK